MGSTPAASTIIFYNNFFMFKTFRRILIIIKYGVPGIAGIAPGISPELQRIDIIFEVHFGVAVVHRLFRKN